MKKGIIGIALALIIIGVFVYYVALNWQQFSELRLTNPSFLLPAIFMSAVNVYAVGALMDVALRPFGIHLSQREIFGLASLTRFCRYIAAGYLGAAVRAFYLKKTYQFSYTKFSSTFIVNNVVVFLAAGLLTFLAFVLQGGLWDNNLELIYVLLVAMVTFGGALFIPLNKPSQWLKKYHQKHNSKIASRLNSLLDGFIEVSSRPSLLLQMFLWASVSIVTSGFTILFLFHTLGYQIAFLPALFIAALSGWGVIISLTPANIGVQEGLMVVAAQIMNIPVPTTLVVAILLRLVIFALVAPLSLYFAPKLLNTPLTQIGILKRKTR